MLLLKILLLGEVCTLLLQMETLQSCHLPAQMDWLSVPCMWKRQTRSMVHLCELHGLEGYQMAQGNQHPGQAVQALCAPDDFNRKRRAQSSLRIWVMSNTLFW